MTNKEYDTFNLMNEVDMLKGNINRMCVTDDLDELRSMTNVARIRIDSILEFRLKSLSDCQT